MRHPWSLSVIVCLLGGFGCAGGPISDLPFGDRDNDEGSGPGAEPPAETPHDPDRNEDDGDDDPPPGDMGAEEPEGPMAPDDTADAGIGLGPGGEADHDPDAGAALPPCIEADAGVGDVCQGALCATTLSTLETQIMPGGACASDLGELAEVCEGSVAQQVTQCTQDNALSPALETDVTTCAERKPQLGGVSDDCIACYVQESLCTLRSCLATCLTASSEACDLCRATECGMAFYACSGLPNPAR